MGAEGLHLVLKLIYRKGRGEENSSTILLEKVILNKSIKHN